MKKLMLFVFISLYACTAQSAAPSLEEIAEEAKNNFQKFLDDTTNLKFEIKDKDSVKYRVYKKGNKIRIESIFKKETIQHVVFYDGETGSKYKLSGGLISMDKDYFYRKDINNAFYWIFRDWWKFDTKKARLEGSEKFFGKDCYIIDCSKITGNVGEKYTIWVDKNNLQMVKEEKKRDFNIDAQNRATAVPLQWRNIIKNFKDFQKVAGTWEMAFTMEFPRGEKESIFEYIKSLKLNLDIPEDMFLTQQEKIKAANKAAASGPSKPEAQEKEDPESTNQEREVDKIFEAAKNRFKSFMNNDSNVELVISRSDEFNKVKVFKKGRNIRIESQFSRPELKNNNQVWIYDGETGSILKKNWTGTRISPFPAGKEDMDMLFFQVFNDWWELDKKAANISGSENVDGKDCYVIEISETTGLNLNYKIWVDKSTLCLMKEERILRRVQGGRQTDVRKFLDYKETTDKWAMPYLIESYNGGKKVSSENISSLKLNTEIPDEYFIEEVAKRVPQASRLSLLPAKLSIPGKLIFYGSISYIARVSEESNAISSLTANLENGQIISIPNTYLIFNYSLKKNVSNGAKIIIVNHSYSGSSTSSTPATCVVNSESRIYCGVSNEEIMKDFPVQVKKLSKEQEYLQKAVLAPQKAEPQVRSNYDMQGPGPNAGAQTVEGILPLSELKVSYKGEDGGLYGKGSNEPPSYHKNLAAEATKKIKLLDENGNPSTAGKIVLCTIGMSNTSQESSILMRQAAVDRDKNPAVIIVDGAQGGMTAEAWIPGSGREENIWLTVEKRLKGQQVSAKQVQVVWLKQALAQPAGKGEFPAHTKFLKAALNELVKYAKVKFPNLQLIYLSSRIYGGYATTTLNPEPYAFEGAFSVRGLILDQINGKIDLNADISKGKREAPVLLWGPYLWGNGTTPRKSDGLIWNKEDFGPDGTHPSRSGTEKVAQLLAEFFKTDENTKTWYLSKKE